jgi:hypothetical protein
LRRLDNGYSASLGIEIQISLLKRCNDTLVSEHD